ncbi:MAG: DUF3800 domain-containing protein [Campylobacterota bacterium]|nr:DUF3800 domain-containing protein [Campylobacterota bacterium]
MKDFSDYIVYVDESGDHSLDTINKVYPIFVLTFCIFKKDVYSKSIVTKLKDFKFNHFGYDMVILHESEIRRDRGAFKNLNTKEKKESFLNELTQIIDDEDFTIVSTVIQKENLESKQNNPYDIAMQFCLEQTYKFLESKNQHEKLTHIVVEQRGKNEDFELKEAFNKICNNTNNYNVQMPFKIIMANKLTNSAGLQIADLVARPIGMSVLRPIQENKAFKIIKKKFCNIGLKIHP